MKFSSIFSSRIRINSTLSVLDQISNLGMNFLITILFARYLGVSALGQYSLGLSVVGILSIFSDFGIGTIMAREIAKNSKKTQLYLGNALGIKILISFPLLIFLVLSAIYFLGYSNETKIIILLMTVNGSLLSVIRYIGGALISLHRNDIILKINIINKLSAIIRAFFILNSGYKLSFLLCFFIFVSGVMFIYSIRNIKVLVPNFRIEFNKRFNIKYILISMPLVFGSAAEFINLRIDTVFLASMIGPEAVGTYAAAFNIFLGITLLPLALSKVFFPNFIDFYSKDKISAFDLFNLYSKFFILYSIVISTVSIIFSDLIITTIYGASFMSASDVLTYLAFALPTIILNRHFKYTLLALKENNYYFKITLIGTCLNLLLNYVMIILYGILGAVIATICTELVVMLLGYFKINKIKLYNSAKRLK